MLSASASQEVDLAAQCFYPCGTGEFTPLSSPEPIVADRHAGRQLIILNEKIPMNVKIVLNGSHATSVIHPFLHSFYSDGCLGYCFR